MPGRGVCRPVFPQIALLALIIVQMSAMSVFAQDEPLALRLTQFQVVTAGEDESLVPVEEAELTSGAVIEYQLTAVNVSDAALSDIILQLWIPAGTRYLDGTERLERSAMLLQFSIDGGASFRAAPVRYTRMSEDGSPVQAIATADMYTDLRLVFLRPLAPGEEVQFAYRVELR